jgi:serine/threonine-protein kinase
VPFAGKYAVVRILGVGGMGTVFEARHLRLGHHVAIKVLGSQLLDYPELVTRFDREARAASSLTSRHAVRVFDIDMTEDATPFIVMELLSGRDLARVVETEGPQPIGRAARWIIEACDAIAEAHRLGIIHRDVKPSNLFLTDAGVKVVDFGIAKQVAAKEVSITQAVAPLGTPQYMSPEQVRCAKDVDARTDVWSLGITLYELLTATTPFAHEIPQASIAAIAADPVPDPRTLRPDLPSSLIDVIMKALEKDPKNRWGSVAQLVEALAPFVEPGIDDSLPSVPPAVTKIASPPRARVRSSIVALAVAMVALGALATIPKCAQDVPAPPATAPVAATPKGPEPPVTASEGASAKHTDSPVTITKKAPVMRKPAFAARPVRPDASSRPLRGDSPVHGGLSSPGF